jgi:hypothetical protein
MTIKLDAVDLGLTSRNDLIGEPAHFRTPTVQCEPRPAGQDTAEPRLPDPQAKLAKSGRGNY